MVKNVEERIARIKQQREALAQRLNTLEQKSKSEARKRDTERKIIVGGAIIAQMEKDTGVRGDSVRPISCRRRRASKRPRGHCRFAQRRPRRRQRGGSSKKAAALPRLPRAGECARHGCGQAGNALSTSPPPQAPRAFSPLFTARPIPRQPPADPLASDIDNLSRLLGRKSE